MTVTLPRIDSRLMADDGRLTKEWYRSLKTATDSLNTSLLSATIYSDTGTANYIKINSGVTSYSRGLVRYFVPKYTNTSSAVTLTDGSLAEVQIKLADGTLPAVGQIVANQTAEVIYNGTNWELQVTTSSSSSVAGNFTVGGNLAVTGTSAFTGAVTLTGGVTGAMAATGAVSGTTVTASSYIASGSVAVGSLPSAATAGAGARMFVTDANATTFLSIVAAGGSNKVPVVSNGTNWLIG